MNTPFGEIPRDPGEYRVTEHFRYRFNRREDPEPKGHHIRECIENGDAKKTHKKDNYILEAQIYDVTWWVVVSWDFTSEEWRAVSIYSPDEHDPEEQTPAPV